MLFVVSCIFLLIMCAVDAFVFEMCEIKYHKIYKRYIDTKGHEKQNVSGFSLLFNFLCGEDKMTYCRYCGVEISYKRSKNEKWIPCDAITGEPHFCRDDKGKKPSGIAPSP